MITPQDIKAQCLKAWKDMLKAEVEQASYFPMEISRIGRIGAKDILQHLASYRQHISELQSYAVTWGYELIMEERNFEKIGFQRIPARILIPSKDVYLRITRKRNELETFLRHLNYVRENLPQLEAWCKTPKNFSYLTSHETWQETLAVCRYFLAHPSPDMYLRELPIDVHTKYIEQNQGLIRSLLDGLLPSRAIQTEAIQFEQRYGLKYAEPLVRIRYLDTDLSPVAGWTDVSLPLSQFHRLDIGCRHIILTENKMNFLTFPPLAQSVAIWSGGGFHISYLKGVKWMEQKELIYWGDLDAHGMQILHQCRTYYPNTRSFLMNEETFRKYPQFVTTGASAPVMDLPLLTPQEQAMYHYLQKHTARLEQEHIRQKDVTEECKKLKLL